MDEVDLVVVEVDAVREERALVQRTGPLQPCGDAMPAAGDRVDLVGEVLGHVDVQADAVRLGRLAAGGERLVGERERGVSADHAARERAALSRTRSRKRRFSATPACARSSPSRSEVS